MMAQTQQSEKYSAQQSDRPSKAEQFFKLTTDVRDQLLSANLTAAEWRIWTYLASLDPFGDRGVTFSASDLMLACGVKKSTYFSAKAKFQKLGLFNFVESTPKVVNLQARKKPDRTHQSYQQAEPIDSKILDESQPRAIVESNISELKPEISELKPRILEFESNILEFNPPKPSPKGNCNFPQNRQIYLDFIQTLSDNERENFDKFVREEWRKTKKEEVLSMERFLSKPEDLKNWYEVFLKSPAGSATKQNALATEYDWANHPQRDEWIEEIRQGRPRFIALGGPRGERLMRVSFVDWAEANNLVWGTES